MKPKITKVLVDTTTFNEDVLVAPVVVTIHKYMGSWGVKITAGEGVPVLNHEIDVSISNQSQERFYKELVCWIDYAANSEVEGSLYPVARSISKWVSDTVGAAVVELLNKGKIVTDHHYITVDYTKDENTAVININKNGNIVKTASAVDAMCFLNVFPDTVIYPSDACSFIEDGVLWAGNEDMRGQYVAGEDQRYPIRANYWMAALMASNLTYKKMWDAKGLPRQVDRATE